MPTLTSTTAVSSPLPFSSRPRTTRRPRSPPPSSSSGQGDCGRPLDRVAGWVAGGIAAAFFASLELCSCVNLRTHDDLDDEQSDSEAPLMFDVDGDGNGNRKAVPAVGRRRGGGGSRRNEKGMRTGRGGGMGYYADLNVS